MIFFPLRWKQIVWLSNASTDYVKCLINDQFRTCYSYQAGKPNGQKTLTEDTTKPCHTKSFGNPQNNHVFPYAHRIKQQDRTRDIRSLHGLNRKEATLLNGVLRDRTLILLQFQFISSLIISENIFQQKSPCTH